MRFLSLLLLSSGCFLLTQAYREICGDGFIQTNEECDDGNKNSGDGCDASCQEEEGAVCGNGAIESDEQCDGANLGGEDCITLGFVGGALLCGADCAEFNTNGCILSSCGDGIVDLGEQCDDGNNAAGDDCGPSCLLEECGNGVVDLGEQCDDGNLSNTDSCLNDCQIASCGDGFIRLGFEQCDDGNITDGDGCDALCQIEGTCGDGSIEVGERCFTTEDLPTVGLASRVLIADIDNDGTADDIFACSASHFEPFFNNNGNNGVPVAQSPIQVGALGACVGLTTGDFNGGGVDVAAAYDSPNGTVVLLAEVFASRIEITLNASPREFVSIELNGDAFDDLAVALNNTDQLRTLTDLEDGNNAVNNFATVAQPFGLALGNFNGDNIQDIVVSNSATATSDLFTRDANGALTFSTTINSGCTSFFVKSGHVIGDGKDDLLFSCGGGTVSIVEQNTNGFATPVSVATGLSNTTGLVVDDLDRDGDKDFAVIDQVVAGSVKLLFNNGNGAFTEELSFSTGNAPAGIAVGDINNDTLPDLVVANFQSDFLTLILSNP